MSSVRSHHCRTSWAWTRSRHWNMLEKTPVPHSILAAIWGPFKIAEEEPNEPFYGQRFFRVWSKILGWLPSHMIICRHLKRLLIGLLLLVGAGQCDWLVWKATCQCSKHDEALESAHQRTTRYPWPWVEGLLFDMSILRAIHKNGHDTFLRWDCL